MPYSTPNILKSLSNSINTKARKYDIKIARTTYTDFSRAQVSLQQYLISQSLSGHWIATARQTTTETATYCCCAERRASMLPRWRTVFSAPTDRLASSCRQRIFAVVVGCWVAQWADSQSQPLARYLRRPSTDDKASWRLCSCTELCRRRLLQEPAYSRWIS